MSILLNKTRMPKTIVFTTGGGPGGSSSEDEGPTGESFGNTGSEGMGGFGGFGGLGIGNPGSYGGKRGMPSTSSGPDSFDVRTEEQKAEDMAAEQAVKEAIARQTFLGFTKSLFSGTLMAGPAGALVGGIYGAYKGLSTTPDVKGMSPSDVAGTMATMDKGLSGPEAATQPGAGERDNSIESKSIKKPKVYEEPKISGVPTGIMTTTQPMQDMTSAIEQYRLNLRKRIGVLQSRKAQLTTPEIFRPYALM